METPPHGSGHEASGAASVETPPLGSALVADGGASVVTLPHGLGSGAASVGTPPCPIYNKRTKKEELAQSTPGEDYWAGGSKKHGRRRRRLTGAKAELKKVKGEIFPWQEGKTGTTIHAEEWVSVGNVAADNAASAGEPVAKLLMV